MLLTSVVINITVALTKHLKTETKSDFFNESGMMKIFSPGCSSWFISSCFICSCFFSSSAFRFSSSSFSFRSISRCSSQSPSSFWKCSIHCLKLSVGGFCVSGISSRWNLRGFYLKPQYVRALSCHEYTF